MINELGLFCRTGSYHNLILAGRLNETVNLGRSVPCLESGHV